MLSSGITPITTSGPAVVPLFSTVAGDSFSRLVVINEGTAPGFVSIDGGNTWARVPAGASAASPAIITIRERSNSAPLLKRDGGSDMGGVFAFATWQEAW